MVAHSVAEERWMPVVGSEGSYAVSDQGRVRSLPRVVCRDGHRTHTIKGRLLKLRPHWEGYRVATLYIDKTQRTRFVHRLVLMAFCGPDPHKPRCDHVNGVKHDNRLSNLRWCTDKENIRFARERIGHWYLNGESNHQAKLNLAQVRLVRFMNTHHARPLHQTWMMLAKAWSVNRDTVRSAAMKEKWKCL